MIKVISKTTFNNLLQKVRELEPNENEFSIQEYKFIFRFGVVLELKEERMFPVITNDMNRDTILSLTFDVAGLDYEYMTEIVASVGEDAYFLYITPIRSEFRVQEFVNEIYAISEKVK